MSKGILKDLLENKDIKQKWGSGTYGLLFGWWGLNSTALTLTLIHSN